MSKPSRIQAQAAEIEWRRWNDMDTYYPLRDGKLHEFWAAARLAAVGELTSEQFEAAKRYYALCERANGQGRSESLDRVDNNGADPHARMLDIITSQQRRENAYQFVTCRGAATVRAKTMIRTIDELFRFPAMTFQGMRAVTDESASATTRRIVACLDLLVIYFRNIDRDRKQHAESKALDKIPEHSHTNDHAGEVSVAVR